MTTTPRVSIGLPVYNGARYLREALDSLLSQTFTDFELIISDNASQDATAEICREYAARDCRVRYYREEINRGMAWNFNRVFALARGEYFKWAAYDDLHAPTFIERCVETPDSNPGILWYMPRFTHVDPEGQPLNEPWTWDVGYGPAGQSDLSATVVSAEQESRESPSASQRFRTVLLGDGSCLDNYALIRRAAMATTCLQVPYYGGDKVFVAELCLRGRYYQLPETLFFVRAHPEGSGALATAAEQQYFMDPRRHARLCFTRLHLLLAYLDSVRRAKLSFGQRARCYWAIALYLFQVKKWGYVLRRIVTGAGTGGGYREAADRFSIPSSTKAAQRPRRPAVETRPPCPTWEQDGGAICIGSHHR